MQIGMVGLGRMGANMTRRLLKGGHEVVVFDRSADACAALVKEGARATDSLDALAARLDAPRTAWVMLPSGGPTEETIAAFASLFRNGDTVIDGGNSFFKDDIRRAASLARAGIGYIGVGTSGGVWGLERGYCLMVGGNAEVVRRLDPVFRTLAPGEDKIPRTPGRRASSGTAEMGYLHCGPAGSGHFVKMVHNGIEYGLMQAYAEGFEIMRNAANESLAEEQRYSLPLPEIAELWRRGSVVSSWLLDLTASALAEDSTLASFTGRVEDSGEGRWTIMAAIEEAVPADTLAAALFARFRSRQEHTFAEKMLSAMRHKFGGHVERPAGG